MRLHGRQLGSCPGRPAASSQAIILPPLSIFFAGVSLVVFFTNFIYLGVNFIGIWTAQNLRIVHQDSNGLTRSNLAQKRLKF